MLPIQKNISKYNFYNSNKVEYIVIHDVGALGQAYSNTVYFAGGNRGASAHYFVDPNSIWQSVEDHRGAWHVGDDKPNDAHDVGDLIHNTNSIGIEMCLRSDWSIDPKTINHTVDLVKYLQKKYNVPNHKVVRHYDASGKICPLQMSRNDWAMWKQFKARLQTEPVKLPATGGNTPNSIVVKSGDTLWGLSKQYNVTVAEIKKLNGLKSDVIVTGTTLKLKATASKPALKSLDVVAREVINGVWGNGADRKAKLEQAGYNYSAVQNKVDALLAPKPALKSVSVIAKEVIAGLWGNGSERKNRLQKAGYNYEAVQSKVDELSKPKLKSVDVVAREVLNGVWGNGADRKNRLVKAGYNYDAVQKRVNQLA